MEVRDTLSNDEFSANPESAPSVPEGNEIGEERAAQRMLGIGSDYRDALGPD
jgi:hypothetical protein